MFRRLKKALRRAGLGQTYRPKRRYAPSLGSSLTQLEDRQLLSGQGEHSQAPAQVHAALKVHAQQTSVDTDFSPAALFIEAQYGRILFRAPSDSELGLWETRLRNGLSERRFISQLMNTPERQNLVLGLGVDLYGHSSLIHRLALHQRPGTGSHGSE